MWFGIGTILEMFSGNVDGRQQYPLYDVISKRKLKEVWDNFYGVESHMRGCVSRPEHNPLVMPETYSPKSLGIALE